MLLNRFTIAAERQVTILMRAVSTLLHACDAADPLQNRMEELEQDSETEDRMF